jgi:tRNA (guanine9-N1)-methyltransferase
LLFTSLNGKTLTRLESISDAGYKRWVKAEWWTEGYERLWAEDPAVKQTVVYLTADSDDELTELKPDETYVIGGICDHNRLKVCFCVVSQNIYTWLNPCSTNA